MAVMKTTSQLSRSKQSKRQKVSLIVTVLNEARTIERLLDSILHQTHRPDEVIIVDGGSGDQTLHMIEQYALHHPKLHLQFFTQKGNRSVGRNAAIRAATSELVAITDAGCELQPNWLAELLQKLQPQRSDQVIAGYYAAQPKTPFEEAVVPYVLVMPDKVNPQDFLPATRSMLLSKTVWQKLGGFDEQLSDNEDYAFARLVRKKQIPIIFARNAEVIWFPRHMLSQFYWMIFRFARGDIFAGIVRPKVVLIFVRYLIMIGLITAAILFPSLRLELILTVITLLLLYSVWSIQKNLRYVPHGWYWLPILQYVSDIAVIHGSLAGSVKRV